MDPHANLKKTGRPKIEVDFELVDKLCEIQCTAKDICHVLGCSEDTLSRRIQEQVGVTFADYYKKKSVGGKISLRRAQMEVALKGNVSMLIWLGKQYLGQKDKENDTGERAPILVAYDINHARTVEEKNSSVLAKRK